MAEPRTFLVSWSMDGTFEIRAESEEQIHEIMKTINRQELIFKCRRFDYEIEPVDRSASGQDA
jgi:hypothetical protein